MTPTSCGSFSQAELRMLACQAVGSAPRCRPHPPPTVVDCWPESGRRSVNVLEDDRGAEVAPTAAEDGIAPSSAAFALIALATGCARGWSPAWRPKALPFATCQLWAHLSRSPGISYSELARRTSVTPQSMQATLNELEVIGTVARMTKGGRGRTATLFVTDEGKRLLAMGYSSYAELDALLTEHLDPEHLDPETLTTCCCRSWRSCGVSTPGDVDRGHLRFAGSRSWWRMRQQNLSAVPDSPARPTTSPQCGSRWFRRCAGKAWTPSCTDREADQRRGPGRGTSGLGGVW